MPINEIGKCSKKDIFEYYVVKDDVDDFVNPKNLKPPLVASEANRISHYLSQNNVDLVHLGI